MICAVETSCDDTCAAVVTASGQVLANTVASQGLLHARYGGVVPEIAARRHLELIDDVVADALETAGTGLDRVDYLAVTQGPGLIGALLVGFAWAKAAATAHRRPLCPVDHLHGHVVASTLSAEPIEPPYVCLVASGGHTFLARVDDCSGYRILGQTLDDSAGEAFDKAGRMLGLGYPGGPAIDRLARGANSQAFDFPRSLPGSGLDFSFSGLKTALYYRLRDRPDEIDASADLAASYQRAIVDVLCARLRSAIVSERVDRVALGGGVAANSELRLRARAVCDELSTSLWVPPVELCTDNAAMIAAAARFLAPIEYPDYLGLDATARLADAGRAVNMSTHA